jgi:sugar (pentulose or hexulose) kinase
VVWNRIRATVLATVAPVSVIPSASSSVGAAILAAHALHASRSLRESVDRLVPPPEPVDPVATQRDSLDRAYQRFVDLVEGSLRHA